MNYLLRLSACLLVLLSFNAKALVINGCTIEPNTSCINANLSNQIFWDGDLSGANLYGANLSNSIFEISLSGAILDYTNLNNAFISEYSNLNGASLLNAFGQINTDGGYFIGAYLHDANLSGSYLDSVYFSNAPW